MSSSTAYQHLQSGDEENARKSISVAKKSLAIINKLNCNEMRSTMEQMARAIDNKIDAPAVDETSITHRSWPAGVTAKNNSTTPELSSIKAEIFSIGDHICQPKRQCHSHPSF